MRNGTIARNLLHAGGALACVAAYVWLALMPSRAIAPGDESFRWGLIDKRPLVFAYILAASFIAFHYFMRAPAYRAGLDAHRAGTTALGAAAAALLAFALFAVPLLRTVADIDPAALAHYYGVHADVHLAPLDQIRLGATPYLEAQTQYGPGNQLLAYAVTVALHFSNHGFHAAFILINAVCIVGFFIVVQQCLGLRWACLGILGWLLWPAPPDAVAFLPGWAMLTRWIAVPVLSLVLPCLLLGRGSPVVSPLLSGAVWGFGGFLSQENFSGGLMVLAFSLALFGPAGGLRLIGIARFAALFVAAGLVVFAVLVAAAVGIANVFEVLRLTNLKSSLVMAGVSNTFWSDNVAFAIGFRTINGWRLDLLTMEGDLRPLLQTYGFALLLPLALALTGRVLATRWPTMEEGQRLLVRRFAGVAIGASVLHLFALLRSDLPHLAAPSFLLPLLLLTLPLFAWHCLRPGLGRNALLLLSAGLIAEALVGGRVDLGRKLAGVAGGWHALADAAGTYSALAKARAASDLADRYSPLPGHQAPFRAHGDFEATRELFALLRERAGGRPIEIAFSTPVNGLIESPESFYFFGGFRSMTGMVSPQTGIWLRSEEKAWIEKVSSAQRGCVFFGPNPTGPIYEAWKQTARSVIGTRDYGLLACRG